MSNKELLLSYLVKEAISRRELVSRYKPSEAEIKADNYPKLHLRIQGIDISIENPKGSYREGVDPNGRPWKSKLYSDYGSITRGTHGMDGDALDVFIGPNARSSEVVHVIDQVDPKTQKADEHKCMLGWATQAEAKRAYLKCYEPKWQGLGDITTMTLKAFKKWIRSDASNKPVSHIIKIAQEIIGAPWPSSYKNKSDYTTTVPSQGVYQKNLFPKRYNNPVNPKRIYQNLENTGIGYDGKFRAKGYDRNSNTWTSYKDGVGIDTIGWGQTKTMNDKPLVPGRRYPASNVDRDLNTRIEKWRNAYRSIDPRFDKLPSRYRAALLAQKGNTGTTYKNLFSAMLSGSPDILTEYNSHATIDGVKRPIAPRNDAIRGLLNEQLESIRAGNPLSYNTRQSGILAT